MKQRLYRRNQILDAGNIRNRLMAFLENMISQPSLEMSPIWLPIIKEKIERIQENGSLR
jgi:hypothetical protein